MSRGQWAEATAAARQLGADALRNKNFVLSRKVGILLGRLQDHRASAHLMSISMRQLDGTCALPEWDGSDLLGRTLLVISRNMHVGPVIRYGRLLALAARRAKRCIALVEPRLLPLFRRSLPSVDIWEAGPADERAYAEADVVASYETLTEFIGTDESGAIIDLPALQPDQDQTAAFRARYRREAPLIGICWHSTNEQKELPDLNDWAGFLCRLSATFVSLQYGDAQKDAEAIRRLSKREIIHDRTVDSLKDLDAFAAQIKALDAVVTISNTGAHMAGALDAPLYVLLDDKDHLMWPFVGRTSDWYRSAKLYRKAGRPWADVFQEIAAALQAAMTQKIAAP